MKNFNSFLPVLVASLAAAFGPGVNQASAAGTQPTGSNYRNSYPGNMIGRIQAFRTSTLSSIGTGTAIKPYSVLTAGHMVYSKDYGWSQNVIFKRAYYNGSSASANTATYKVVLGGYTSAVNSSGTASAAAFANDLAGFVCRNLVHSGGYAGWWANPTLLKTAGYTKQILGYGGESYYGHNTQLLLYNRTTVPYATASGMWLKNPGMGGEPGMSGGPVLVWANSSWTVTGVHVSGIRVDGHAVNTRDAGCRALDSRAATLIRDYLR